MKCKNCYDGKVFLAPELILSGYSSYFMYKCPVCDRIYSESGKDTTEEFIEKYKGSRLPKSSSDVYNSNKFWR